MCIDKSLEPRCALVLTATAWIPTILPWEDGALQVGHHGKMTTVGTAYTSHVVVGTVGVARIFGVVVFCHYIIVVLGLRQIETTFAMSYPYTQFATAEGAEHHTVVAWNVESKELALEFLRVVVAEVSLVLVVGIDEVEFCHKLATVADTQ